MADYNLTNQWSVIDQQTTNANTQLTPTLGNVLYHANGNGVTASEAATAIKGAKDGNIGISSPVTTDADLFNVAGFTRATVNTPVGDATAIIEGHYSSTIAFQMGCRGSDKYYVRAKGGASWNANWQELYHTGNTGSSTVFAESTGSLVGQVALNIGAGNSSWIETYKDSAATREHYSFFNTNGKVGSITTLSSATSYNTTSDNRLKSVIGKPTDEQINAKFDDIYDTFTLFNWKNNPDGEAVWGFLAHDVIDKGLDFGSEGDGPRNLNIGDVYETIPEETEERPIMETVTDEDGNETEQQATDENGNLLFETVVVKEAVEKRVSPAGVDQSKVVPYLVAKIEQQDRIINELLQRIEALEAK